MKDLIEQFESLVGEIDFLLQEGVVLTTEESDKLSKLVSAANLIANSFEVR